MIDCQLKFVQREGIDFLVVRLLRARSVYFVSAYLLMMA